MNSIIAWIAKLGQTTDFVAFNAHWGFAFFVMQLAHGNKVAAGAALILAAAKEFWFDPRYEVNPPQKIWPDGVLDFSGYLFGIALGTFIR